MFPEHMQTGKIWVSKEPDQLHETLKPPIYCLQSKMASYLFSFKNQQSTFIQSIQTAQIQTYFYPLCINIK